MEFSPEEKLMLVECIDTQVGTICKSIIRTEELAKNSIIPVEKEYFENLIIKEQKHLEKLKNILIKLREK